MRDSNDIEVIHLYRAQLSKCIELVDMTFAGPWPKPGDYEWCEAVERALRTRRRLESLAVKSSSEHALRNWRLVDRLTADFWPAIWQMASNSPPERLCGYASRVDPPKIDDVAWVYGIRDGSSFGPSWIAVFQDTARLVVLRGVANVTVENGGEWSDGCVAHFAFAWKADDAIRFGLDLEERVGMGLELPEDLKEMEPLRSG